MSGYQPRGRWERPATQPHTGTKAPREGAYVEINGRRGRVSVFDAGMNTVNVDWDDKGRGVPGDHYSFWVISDWKKLWGEKP